ncbi:MAG TPA: hypothetical protein DCE56_03095, partial [Cyanobacteria bacterium UBA8553]|nr:hypothetical protein [Cyanobacteria bacterium UBA8553]
MDTSGEKLELYLDFSEIEGTQVIDQSGEDRHGNLPDGFIFQVDPVVGGCLSFNGTSDYVELPEKLAIDYSDGFTVEAWVYYLSFNRWSRIIDFSNEAGRDNILFANFEQTNNLILQVYSDSLVGTLQAENVLKIGEWLHLAATISSNGEAILYVDGQQVAKGSVHLPDSVPRKRNYIGRNNWEPDGYFQGKMANVRVYSRVLTGAEIQQDWNADKIVIPPSTHPLNFSLLDDDQQPVLFITDNLKGHNLYLEVVNTSDQAITLVGNQLEGSENRAKAGNCYLELWFRPKTVPTEAEFLKPRQSGQSDWTIHSRLGENGSVSLYLTSTTAPSLKPGEKLFFTLPHMLASGNSSRGTNVRLKYDYY